MKNLTLAFLSIFLFAQCQNDPVATTGTSSPATEAKPAENPYRPKGEPTGRTEIGNFEYWHYIKNDGPKPLPSQAVFYSYRITKLGQFVQGNFGGDPSGGIMPSEEEATKNPQALAEAMRRMAVGDSVSIIYPTKFPDTFFVYDIVLKGIYNR